MKITPEDLEIKIKGLDFESTKEITPIERYVGQQTAYEMMKWGLDIEDKSHNIFVCGPVSTGRRTFAKKIISEYAKKKEPPMDFVYVYNFSNPKQPKALSLKAGMAKQLKKDLEEVFELSIQALRKGLESKEFSERKAQLEKDYSIQRKQLWEHLNKKALELGYTVKITPTGMIYIPVKDGKPLSDDEYNNLSEEEKQFYEDNAPKLKLLVESTMNKANNLDREFREQLKNLEKHWVLFSISHIFEYLKNKYKEFEEVCDYIDQIRNDIAENFYDLVSDEEDMLKFYKKKYNVNIIVDNSELNGAPVIELFDPTYPELIGKIEYYSQMGILQTDFTMIKPGALHKANGGYLILDAEKVLRYSYVWEGLKRSLISGKIEIKNLEHFLGLSSVHTLDPEPIPLKIKVILIGEEWIYDLLSLYDPDFKKLFNIKVIFDTETELNDENAKDFAAFVSSVVEKHNLKHFTKDAVEELIRYACRLSGRKDKFSMKLGHLKNLIIKIDSLSKDKEENLITKDIVRKALEKHEKMYSLYKEKIFEYIEKNILMLDMKGMKIGQINGLTVIEQEDLSFGVPVKITAKVHQARESGLIDIQRDAYMSGSIHRKATLILENYFYSKYKVTSESGFSASISFEQVYSLVEGDSASLAEALVLISAISGIPINQSIAVTGSINQFGEVQPVGGIIEKIEGFYYACKKKNIKGVKGVIIPKANYNNLVLKDEIIEDIKKGEFNIWTVSNVDEALEIVTGMKAGKLQPNGEYEFGTVNRRVVESLGEIKRKKRERKTEEKK